MISICAGCSGIDFELLENTFGAEKIECSCIGECGGRDGLVIGYVDGEFVEAETDAEFIEKVKNM